MEKSLQLYANCLPVKGARRSIICDLQRHRYSFIPNELYSILTEMKGRSISEVKAAYSNQDHSTIESYFAFLLDQGYGFMCDNPAAFPALDLSWDYPAAITNAIIDVDRCSAHDYSDIFAQLHEVGCTAVQIRAFDCLRLSDVSDIVTKTRNTSLRSVDLILRYSDELNENQLEEFSCRHPIVSQIVVHGAPSELQTLIKPYSVKAFFQCGQITVESCGQVHPAYFSVTVEHLTEARHNNSCLNRKLSICSNGDIRVCPSIPPSFGNIKNTRIKSVLKDERLSRFWKITKDDVEVCRDCEFRYICTDCRAYTVGESPTGKPSKCRYDPYTATWQGDARNIEAELELGRS